MRRCRIESAPFMNAPIRGMIVATVLGAAAALLLASIGPALQTRPVPTAIAIENFTFNPQRFTVVTGTTVTWTNRDDIPHAVAAVSKLFKSKALDTDDTFSFTFTTPGTYQYFCSLHPHMTATIVVEAATGSSAGR
jgi:plastocyanin